MTTDNKELIEVLRGIGLDDNQALIYLTILELGPSSIWDVAKKTGIKRPTCYVILDELTFRGFASKAHDGRRTIYSVITPKQMLFRLEKRYEKFRNVSSQLEGIASKSPQKPIISLYEGISGVKQAYDLTLLEQKGSEILIYGTAKVADLMPEYISDYLRERTGLGIKVRALVADIEENRSVISRDTKELRETRFLEQKYFDPHLEVNIFGDTLIYIAHSEKEPFATVIKNSTIANHEKQRFEIEWNIAKKIEVNKEEKIKIKIV